MEKRGPTLGGDLEPLDDLPQSDRLAAAEWRADRLRKALEQVAAVAKGPARTLALQALDADALAFPGVPQNSGEADPTADPVEGGDR